MMIKERLEQYTKLGKELATLERQLEQEYVVTDTVKGSSRYEPYGEHTITITGINATTLTRLRRRRQRVKAERAAIEAFVESIQDSHLRTVITLRYVKGMPWAQVASNIGGNTPDSVRMAVERFLRKG